jgi:hypothetical protein
MRFVRRVWGSCRSAPRRALARSVGRCGDCRHNQPVGDSNYPYRRGQVGRPGSWSDRHHPVASMTALSRISGKEIRAEFVRTCGALVMFGVPISMCAFCQNFGKRHVADWIGLSVSAHRQGRTLQFQIEFMPLVSTKWDRCQFGLRDLHVALRRVEARPITPITSPSTTIGSPPCSR